MKFLTAAIAMLALAAPALAEGNTTYDFDGSFEDATFALESAIVGQGLVIDYVSHTGDMLARTAADVGSEVKLFDAADIFLFCSAVVSRKVIEADLSNIGHCPYGIFVTDIDGQIQIGFRNMPEGPMQEVQALLDGIAKEAVGE